MSVPVPVKRGVIVGVSLRAEQIPEHSPEVGNVGLSFKLERTAVGQVFGKLRGTSLAECGDGDRLFLFHNELVLLGG